MSYKQKAVIDEKYLPTKALGWTHSVLLYVLALSYWDAPTYAWWIVGIPVLIGITMVMVQLQRQTMVHPKDLTDEDPS